MRPHPYRRALWMAWFGLALCGAFLAWNLASGNWLGVVTMVVLIGLGVFLLYDIRRKRREMERWRRDLHR